nr:hypothetical protein B0A51_06059 [Rachicladosporium sp. CCFEE 5018]
MEKDNISPHVRASDIEYDKEADLEVREVFKKDIDGGVQFRTVSWQRAAVVFLKIQFAMSILAVPGALATLGAVGGAISIVGWGALNTYTAIVLGDFHNRHPECHTLADMMGLLWGRIGRALVGAQILVAQVLITAAGIVSISTAFNALSEHGACTVAFSAAAAVLITGCSSIRTFSRLGWLTWAGFITFFIAVFIFVVAVTQQDRPAAAPPTGDFDLGWASIAYPTFIAGITASANIFISCSGSSMYLPVISEMRRPKDYRKAALVAGILVVSLYLTFSLVTYRWCGVWLSTPAFGSAGTMFKKISYGIALPGLVIGVGIYQHVAAKLVFVWTLRDSKHLQSNSVVHWSTWLGLNLLLGALGFIVAEAVPILNYLLGLAGSLCFAPFSLIFPALLWMYDFRSARSGPAAGEALYGFHVFIVLLGLFMVIGGTYGVALSIRDAFATGAIARVFDCSDNSGTRPSTVFLYISNASTFVVSDLGSGGFSRATATPSAQAVGAGTVTSDGDHTRVFPTTDSLPHGASPQATPTGQPAVGAGPCSGTLTIDSITSLVHTDSGVPSNSDESSLRIDDPMASPTSAVMPDVPRLRQALPGSSTAITYMSSLVHETCPSPLTITVSVTGPSDGPSVTSGPLVNTTISNASCSAIVSTLAPVTMLITETKYVISSRSEAISLSLSSRSSNVESAWSTTSSGGLISERTITSCVVGSNVSCPAANVLASPVTVMVTQTEMQSAADPSVCSEGLASVSVSSTASSIYIMSGGSLTAITSVIWQTRTTYLRDPGSQCDAPATTTVTSYTSYTD